MVDAASRFSGGTTSRGTRIRSEPTRATSPTTMNHSRCGLWKNPGTTAVISAAVASRRHHPWLQTMSHPRAKNQATLWARKIWFWLPPSVTTSNRNASSAAVTPTAKPNGCRCCQRRTGGIDTNTAAASRIFTNASKNQYSHRPPVRLAEPV